MVYSYRTRGTCSRQIDVELDGDIIKSVQFYGGCNGNLQGISAIVRGKTIAAIRTNAVLSALKYPVMTESPSPFSLMR